MLKLSKFTANVIWKVNVIWRISTDVFIHAGNVIPSAYFQGFPQSKVFLDDTDNSVAQAKSDNIFNVHIWCGESSIWLGECPIGCNHALIWRLLYQRKRRCHQWQKFFHLQHPYIWFGELFFWPPQILLLFWTKF